MNDPWIIRLAGGITGIERYPELAEMIGGYVQGYQPERAPLGEQWLWVTDDPEQAKGFDNPEELHRFYSQSIGVRPWDGKPDRPITAFHIETARRSKFMEKA